MSCTQSTNVSTLEQVQTRTAPKRFRCSVVGCNNEHSSRHLLLTSEQLKTQLSTFVFEAQMSATVAFLHAVHYSTLRLHVVEGM